MHKKELAYSIINISLIVIILFGVVFLCLRFIKPTKYLDKTRDIQRKTDIEKLKTALELYIADGKNFDTLAPGEIYSSLDGKTSINGAGWLPLNFNSVSTGSPLSEIPLDPSNNSTLYYKVGVNVSQKTYEINCRFESLLDAQKTKNDNGNSSDWFEIGSDLNILK
jgi:hypothetical protein